MDQTRGNARGYSVSLRCSAPTKQKIMGAVKDELFDIDIPLPQGVVLSKMVEHILEKRRGIVISDPQLLALIDKCKSELLRYRPEKYDVTTTELLMAVFIHYLESDPR